VNDGPVTIVLDS